MAKRLKMRQRGLFTAAGLLCASATLGLAAPAGAATNQNAIIYGGGSNTTYQVMVGLSDLFNASPGCDLAAPSGSTQNLDYRCPNPANNTGGENGLGDGLGYKNTATGMTSPQGDPENPYNDVSVELPAVGSSAGIEELVQGNIGSGVTANYFPINFARSSRGPNNGLPVPTGSAPSNTNTSDPQGLNFVAYGADAVPWLAWKTCTGACGSVAHAASVTTLSIPQLASIYNGLTTDWATVGGTAGPIDVYMAQKGSGTESTWKTNLGLTSDTPAGITNTATHVIFENEVGGILKNGDEGNALFYFSYGDFHVRCNPNTSGAATICNGKPVNGSVFLGAESLTTGGTSIKPTPPVYKKGKLKTAGTILDGSYPTDRFIYNVYSNGNNGLIPAANQATLNFVSEAGTICKQDSAVDSNSNTSATYGTEIQNVIKAQGFFPLTSAVIDSADNPTTPTNVGTGSITLSNGYAFVDPLAGSINSSTKGNCRVFTTDGDGTTTP